MDSDFLFIECDWRNKDELRKKINKAVPLNIFYYKDEDSVFFYRGFLRDSLFLLEKTLHAFTIKQQREPCYENICSLVSVLDFIHFFHDGNARTNDFCFQFLVCVLYGFSPLLIYDPAFLSFGNEQIHHRIIDDGRRAFFELALGTLAPSSRFDEYAINEGRACTGRWLSDKEVDDCGRCGVNFGIFTRRHHCRQCGGIFCNSCSNHRMVVQSLAYATPTSAGRPGEELRVCNNCHTRSVNNNLVPPPDQAINGW